MIDELISQRWESEEKEILANIDAKLAQLRFSNVNNKLAKVKETKTNQRMYRIKDLMFED